MVFLHWLFLSCLAQRTLFTASVPWWASAILTVHDPTVYYYYYYWYHFLSILTVLHMDAVMQQPPYPLAFPYPMTLALLPKPPLLQVDHVCNLTDIDDKIIRRMARDGMGLKALTNKYADLFFLDLTSLNVVPASLYPRATDHIEEIVAMIQTLMEKVWL